MSKPGKPCLADLHSATYDTATNQPTNQEPMKSIVTKYLPCTSTRGSRIKASAEGVKSLTIPYPHELSGEEVHRAAAIELSRRNGWSSDLVGGCLPDQTGYAFCFSPERGEA